MAECEKRKKKKGKSFIQKAKKFGKQGQRGKGTEIEQDQYDYLVRVMERWRDGFDNDEEKTMFVENVFDQTDGEERKLCGNQLASRVIELLLPSADQKILSRFCSALATDLRLVCLDPFMSHVLEKLLILQSFHDKDKDVEMSDEDKLEGREWVLKVCRFVTNNLEDFCHDLYASHLLRTCTQCVAGHRSLPVGQGGQGQGQRTAGYDTKVVWSYDNLASSVEEFAEVLETYTGRILNLGADNLSSEMCIHVLQVYLEVVSMNNPKLMKTVVKHLIKNFIESDTFDWDDVPSVRLLECIIKVGINHPKLNKKIVNVLDGKLPELSVHPVANFVTQRLLENVSDKEQFSTFCSSLSGEVENILSAGCTGVILSMAKACVRLETNQAAVLTELTAALSCSDNQDLLAPCLAHMVTTTVMAEEEKSFPVHLHGSLIIQQLLLFNKPIKVVRSLLAMSSFKLASLLGDPRGCHITDTFMTSKTIGEKSREGLVKSLKGEFVTLSCGKHGSRTVDNLWKYSSTKQKQTIVEELASKLDVLNSNNFGKFIVQKCYVAVYKRNKEDWKKLVEKEDKIGDMFSEIIGDAKPIIKRKVEEVSSNKDEPPVKKVDKKEALEMVDAWLKSDSETEPKKKKKVKAKSYLDDL